MAKEFTYTEHEARNGLGVYMKGAYSANPKQDQAKALKKRNRKRNKLARKARRK